MQDYHLRVGDVISDTQPSAAAPVRELRLDETEVGRTKYVSYTEIVPQSETALSGQTHHVAAHLGLLPQTAGLVEQDIFASIYNPGTQVALLIRLGAARSTRIPGGQSRSRACRRSRHRVVRTGCSTTGSWIDAESPQCSRPETHDVIKIPGANQQPGRVNR